MLALVLLTGAVQAQDRVVTNSIGIEFVLIDTGSMIVGKFEPPYPTPDDTIKNAERPMIMWMGDGRSYNAEEFSLARQLAMNDYSRGFKVKISRPYYIGRFEVTQGQWQRLMGNNPSVFNLSPGHPADNVTWEDAQRFINRLNELEGVPNRYRLPTEFEWEYAARAGAPGDIPWAETEKVAQLGGRTTQPVGKKTPNVWGLYDMLGNVWEWVEDYYNERIFADPVPPTSGSVHVLKGASFTGDVKNATWFTHAGGPGNGWDVGFRIVMEPENNK